MDPAAAAEAEVWKPTTPLKEVTEEASSPRFSNSPATPADPKVEEAKGEHGADAYPEQVFVVPQSKIDDGKLNLRDDGDNPEVIVPHQAPEQTPSDPAS